VTATASIIGDTPPTTSLGRRSEPGGVPEWRGRAIAVVRIAFGVVWAVDAWFKWQPTFVNGFTGYLAGAKGGQPHLVKSWIDLWVNIVKVNPSLFAHLLAVAETTVAVGLIFGIFVNLAYVNGTLLAVLIWSTAEGFGGPYKAGSTDIGAAIIYVLVFAGLFLAGSGRYLSLDARYRRRQRRHEDGRRSGIALGSRRRADLELSRGCPGSWLGPGSTIPE
jgi:uncharacterized membrane protein YphA (DoxX/SURF4 family)